ncbi:hypothetical protein GIB67_038529 [Kingdonia uniflora]|uniref:Trichome birefringence-like N-terminal domain-containing protein n=1 Tax=Kingdonia uniflora TaxID=39325 RepID=A0A7J7NPZ1_9MAGN|nr:hypothetical protein GIB67_038529 [Kingdonia uniflora]
MKYQPMEIPYGKNHTLQNTPKIVFQIIGTLILLTTILLYYPLLGYPSFLLFKTSSSSTSSHNFHEVREHSLSVSSGEKCDIFTGEWVRNPDAPYYTNTTCWAIHDHQNCMKYGRPDSEFMKWKWQPDGCDLPIFNPAQFLEVVRGKSLAFVGDSVGRNQMQSLICLLSRVVYPVEVWQNKAGTSTRWHYEKYNFTVVNFWTPHLVKAKEADPNGPTLTGLFNLYLDEFDESWTTQIDEFDYVIISGGHWFFRPEMYYENNKLVGCHYCQEKNVTDLQMYYGYRKAFRTAFKAINSLENYKGVTFLRTFSPSHFENGIWNKGGNCVKQKPFASNETHLENIDLELYMTQLEEFKTAEKEGMKRGLKFRLLDTTQAMLMRPDGHPSRYGHLPGANVTLYNDCVHWCLPGPIDTWNDFLLQMLKMEGGKSRDS